MAHMYKNAYFKDGVIPSERANLSIASSAVLYGLSVYTVFAVSLDKDGNKLAFRLHDHFRRLQHSAKIIGISTFEPYWTYEKFHSAVQELFAANVVNEDVFVRVTVHVDEQIAGTRSRGLNTTLSMFIYDSVPILKAKGVRLKTSIWRRVPDNSIPSRAKVNGAYVNSVLAKQDALDNGYDDCVFLDAQGHVCELSAANIFIVRNGKIVTPDSNHDLLEGINRRTVIELAREDLGLEVVERSIDLTELYIADEIFASGTSANISSVKEVDARIIGSGKIGPVTKKIQNLHSQLRHGTYKNSRDWLITI